MQLQTGLRKITFKREPIYNNSDEQYSKFLQRILAIK